MTRTPHDGLFKRTFSNVALAQDELRAVVPVELRDVLDWRTLRLEAGETVDDQLRARFSDVLLSVAAPGAARTWLWFLLEHQSKDDPLLCVRVHAYVAGVWARHLADHPGARTIPPVLPVVLRHDGRAAARRARLSDLYRLPPDLQATLGPLLPELGVLIDDLGAATEEELGARTASPYLRLVYWVLRARGSPAPGRTRAWASTLARLERADAEAILSYLTYTGGDGAGRVVEQAARLSPAVRELHMALYEKWLNEGFEKGKAEGRLLGRKEGRKEGHSQGRAEAKAATLLKLLELRFGPLPSELSDRVRRAEEDRLDRWTERVLTARTPQEVLED